MHGWCQDGDSLSGEAWKAEWATLRFIWFETDVKTGKHVNFAAAVNYA